MTVIDIYVTKGGISNLRQCVPEAAAVGKSVEQVPDVGKHNSNRRFL